MTTETTTPDTTPRETTAGDDQATSATDAAMTCFRQFAREKPETVALWALGIGFVLGWKLKPW